VHVLDVYAMQVLVLPILIAAGGSRLGAGDK